MPVTAVSDRSHELEKIRVALRKHLDKCAMMTSRSSFIVTHETPILLTPSERTAMRRQIEASHEDRFFIKMSFKDKRRRKTATTTSSITITAMRKQYLRTRRNASS